jgi:glutamine cyclotransferase
MKIASLLTRHGLMLTLITFSACGRQGSLGDVPLSPAIASGENSPPARYSFEVVDKLPHDPSAFTQGLVFRNGELLESTGLNGRSTLRDVDLRSGRVLHKKSLPTEYFGEGLAVIGTKAYQLTWKGGKGFIYDVDTFDAQGEFTYAGEGWGLTTDGKLLVLSDGTSRIRFIDPASSAVVRTIEVTLAGKPLERINELEWIKGEIFANVWQTDTVVRIDPTTGRVQGVIDFTHLLSLEERGAETDVLNGIAYDAGHDRLYITGKCWPVIFEVRLKPVSP